VGGDAGDAGVLIEAKVVGHGAARDELRGAGGSIVCGSMGTRMNSCCPVEV